MLRSRCAVFVNFLRLYLVCFSMYAGALYVYDTQRLRVYFMSVWGFDWAPLGYALIFAQQIETTPKQATELNSNKQLGSGQH